MTTKFTPIKLKKDERATVNWEFSFTNNLKPVKISREVKIEKRINERKYINTIVERWLKSVLEQMKH